VNSLVLLALLFGAGHVAAQGGPKERVPAVGMKSVSTERHEVVYDPVTQRYFVYNKIGNVTVGRPRVMTAQEYRDFRREEAMRDYPYQPRHYLYPYFYLTPQGAYIGPLLPARMEMPVGPGTAVFAVPTLRPATIHERGFVLPTARRGVVTVGPVVSVQSDPVGLLRRERTCTQAQLVHIHPRTVRVGSSLHGLMRDVEGAVTQELSSSDVSFHALRDYVPGDDRRNIHWRTTAHTGRLMVRQFEETHRSSLLILLDCLIDDYEVEEDFETAVSVACSLSLDAISDGREVTLATQDEELPTATGLRLLDASCLVTSTAIQGCDDLARQASSRHPEASVIILVTGQRCEEQTLARVRTLTPLDAVVLALRCGSNAMGRRSVGGVTAYDLDRIESLPRIMRRAS